MLEPDLFISTQSGDRDTVTWLNNLFLDAARQQVNDVHFQECDGVCRVRFRLPGGLADVGNIEGSHVRIVDEKIRSRAQLPTSNRVSAHDGRMQLRWDDLPDSGPLKLDIRVAITPNNGGQLTVCRLLDQSGSVLNLNNIEMTSAVRYSIDQLIEEPAGLFLVTGPTGSGKTTTLYSIINALNTPDRNIITIEEPVEYTIGGISQIDVDQHLTFPNALRAVLRQDPDVILVGEIRDAETAAIAIAASMTGHLVLATLHANSSVQAISRLLDLGVDIHTLAPALRGITAQRLVRRVSGECPMYPPNTPDKAWLEAQGLYYPHSVFPEVSDESGFSGYLPLIEMLVCDEHVRKTLGKGEAAIFAAVNRQVQFETIAQAGTRLAGMGRTTLQEVRRVTGSIGVSQAPVRRLGGVLIDHGVITPSQLEIAIETQINMRRGGIGRQIGDILVDLGFCTREDIAQNYPHAGGA